MKRTDALLKRVFPVFFCILAAGYLSAQTEEGEEMVSSSGEAEEKYNRLMQSATDTLYDTAAFFRNADYRPGQSGWKKETRGLDYREYPPEPEKTSGSGKGADPFSLPRINFEKLNDWLGYGGLTLLMGLLAFLIYRVIRERIRERSSEEELRFSTATDPGKWAGIELEELLRKALAEANRPAALRVMFLISLKELNDLGFVRWKKNKTNAHYLREIQNPDIQKPFRLLSQAFDAARYGGYPVSDTAFSRIGQEFKSLKSFLEPFRQKENRP